MGVGWSSRKIQTSIGWARNNSYTPIGSILYSCNWGWDGAEDGWYSTALMEFPTIKNAAYLDNNTQLYIDGLNTGGRNNNVNDDSLPPF